MSASSHKIQQLKNRIKSEYLEKDKLKLLYDWVKSNHVNLKEFVILFNLMGILTPSDEEEQMNLGDLINELERYSPSHVVEHGFGEGDSYRGYYYQIAFPPCERTTVKEMLKHANACVGETFSGYKGGEYLMGVHTAVNIACYGSCSFDNDDIITRLKLRCILKNSIKREELGSG